MKKPYKIVFEWTNAIPMKDFLEAFQYGFSKTRLSNRQTIVVNSRVFHLEYKKNKVIVRSGVTEDLR